MTGESLKGLSGGIFGDLDDALKRHRPAVRTRETGVVTEVSEAVASVAGFSSINNNELISFPGGLLGIAANLSLDSVGVILLGESERLSIGAEARRTHRVVDIAVGKGLLGRVVNATGRPLDDKGPVDADERMPIERPAPAIINRAPVATPLQTGIKAIDAAIPIGWGQRELILGDRQTGKTAIAVDAIINQRDRDVICIYCAIGQRGASVARVIKELEDRDAMENCIVVVAASEEPPGLQFVAPYAATSMAEYFMERGRDVLIVYDDLTRHARAYRELSLLLRRPPGREAYPGDIFFIHSRLLERATHLRGDKGGGSLTALPIIETQAQNISAYIPTNLISITDGQIYLSPELFRKGQMPAVDIGKSVSRVGGKAQLPAFRTVAGDLRLSYSQFEELETFARFGTRLDDETRKNLERGRRVREILKQQEHDLMPAAEQIVILLAATQGLFDAVPLDDIGDAEMTVRQAVRDKLADQSGRISKGEKLGDEDREAILSVIGKILEERFPADREK
jgi:F-type H+-transporting ATPase subunit alpha